MAAKKAKVKIAQKLKAAPKAAQMPSGSILDTDMDGM